jgi:hypothetical protein
MLSIGSLLDKFRSITNHSLAVREAAIYVFEKELSIKISKESLRFKDGVLSVGISGPAKVEIFLARESLSGEINKRLGREFVQKII